MSLAQRRERLLNLLPALYRHQLEKSAVSTLIEVMAGQLAAFDQAAEQVLRNCSLAGAEGDRNGEAALEQLGELVQVHRLPEETTAQFRERIRLIGSIIRQGAITPKAVLTLALVDLGLSPCPHMVFSQSIAEAWGIPWEQHQLCVNCSGPSQSCPQPERQGPPTVRLFDNPFCRAVYHEQVQGNQHVIICNDSLFADRPVLELRGIGQTAASGLTIQSRRTGEGLRYAGKLRPGEILRIFPGLSQEEQAPFRCTDAAGADNRNFVGPGQAQLRREGWGGTQDISSRCTFLWAGNWYAGAVNDESARNRFAQPGSREGLRFEQSDKQVQVPVLLPGDNFWSVSTGYEENDSLLFDLRCTWRTRKPFTFLLSIPRTEQVRQAEQQGRVDLIHRDLERVRGAGIRAEVVFSDPALEKFPGQPEGRNMEQNTLIKRVDQAG
jgi:hypothetical protein